MISNWRKWRPAKKSLRFWRSTLSRKDIWKSCSFPKSENYAPNRRVRCYYLESLKGFLHSKPILLWNFYILYGELFFELRPLSELVYYVIWSKSFCYIFLKEHEISFNKKNWSLNSLILSLSYILARWFQFPKLTCIRQLLQQLHPCFYISTHIAHNLPGTNNSFKAKCLSAGFCPIKSEALLFDELGNFYIFV